jgi:hypothetical protein
MNYTEFGIWNFYGDDFGFGLPGYDTVQYLSGFQSFGGTTTHIFRVGDSMYSYIHILHTRYMNIRVHGVVYSYIAYAKTFKVKYRESSNNFVKIINIRRIWGSYTGDYKEYYLLGYNVVLSVESQPTFWRNTLTLNMESAFSPETSADFQQTT